jgi:hypothetical protein
VVDRHGNGVARARRRQSELQLHAVALIAADVFLAGKAASFRCSLSLFPVEIRAWIRVRWLAVVGCWALGREEKQMLLAYIGRPTGGEGATVLETCGARQREATRRKVERNRWSAVQDCRGATCRGSGGLKGGQSVCLPPCLRPCPGERSRASPTWRRGCGCPDSKVPCFALISLLPTDRTLQFRARFTGNPLRPPPGGFLLCAGVQQPSDSLWVMGWAVSTAAVTHATRVRRRIQVGACLHRSVTCRRRSARRRDGDAEHTSGTRTLQRSSSLPAGRPSSSRREAPPRTCTVHGTGWQ